MFQKRIEELQRKIQVACQKVHRDPQEIKIVVATKYFTVEEMQELAQIPKVIFGENRVQDAIKKIPVFPHQEFHLIGSLQTNKAKIACDWFDMIQSVDSLRLIDKLQECAKHRGQPKRILLQVHANEEPNQHGFSKQELQEAYEYALAQEALVVCGLMTIGSKHIEESIDCFNRVKYFFEKFKKEYNHPSFTELSMGMSQDFQSAIECGSTMIRIGGFFKR